jgi:glycosyltransferase involved in cell wall biosynthesis
LPFALKKIVFTVINDLSYDQRMIRICNSLATNGYNVLLVGRKVPDSLPLTSHHFQQKRFSCFFNKGSMLYAEYNLRVFIFLLFIKFDTVCAIDLDTVLPCLLASKIKAKKRVYDAHELFCEMKEVVTRPRIYKTWKWIEKKTLPHFKMGYTVNEPIALEFKKMYGVNYNVIMNVPVLRPIDVFNKKEKYILYQGAVNEGRSFETLIPAMKNIPLPLIVCGDGNFMQQAKQLVKKNKLENKIIFTGKILPDSLWQYTQAAYIGITIFENNGQSNYYSLANRFFDYVSAGVPQLCVNYPVYNQLNKQYEVAVLINNLSADSLSNALNSLIANAMLYGILKQNCSQARMVWNWQNEEKKLLDFYKSVFESE